MKEGLINPERFVPMFGMYGLAEAVNLLCEKEGIAARYGKDPLRAQAGGVLTRGGHTEATIDLMTLAGFKPAGVLCELTNDDGTMARAPECIEFANKHNMALVTIEDLVAYRQAHEKKRVMLPGRSEKRVVAVVSF